MSQTIDNTLGETVNYSYDYLHRLTVATATNSSWGESYAYDGFGNLTGKTPTVGTAPHSLAAWDRTPPAVLASELRRGKPSDREQSGELGGS